MISSITQFVGFSKDRPQILNLPPFNWLKQVVGNQPAAKSGCNCKASKQLAQYRDQFEAAMSILSDGEKGQLKKILLTEKICYTKKSPDGKINLVCF
jgi:hypothetical protein